MNGHASFSPILSTERRERWPLVRLAVILLFLSLALLASSAIQAQEDDPEREGYIYTVQQGDSWGTVARQVGLTVDELQTANPQAVRNTGWLIVGEQIFIPTGPVDPDAQAYIVESGDSWNSIAERFDVSARLLRAVNPRSVRPGLVLYRGERLLIPPGAIAVAPATQQPETEQSSTPAALEVSPTPTRTASPTPRTTATARMTPTPTATPTPVPAAEAQALRDMNVRGGPGTDYPITGNLYVNQTASIIGKNAQGDWWKVELGDGSAGWIYAALVRASGNLDRVPVAQVTPTASPTATRPPTAAAGTAQGVACPAEFADFPEQLLVVLENAEGDVEALVAFLENCQMTVQTGPVQGDLTGNGLDDVVVIYQEDVENPRQSDLVVFNGTAGGFRQGYWARAAGMVRLLATADINDDGQMDMAWTDTTCGVSTCFDTVYVRSWDGQGWRDWTDGTITMAYADVQLDDLNEEGQGDDLILYGGVYGSVGAGPQRSRTEIWGSVDGNPYTLLAETFDASDCLYHTVIDANRAFARELNFEMAYRLYEGALEDSSLTVCWTRAREMEELHSFSLFRLAVLAGYLGDPDRAAAWLDRLSRDYPDAVYTSVGGTWQQAYGESGDPAAACRQINELAADNPNLIEILADYGYANPTFAAADVCPVLDVEVPASDGVDAPETESGALPDAEPAGGEATMVEPADMTALGLDLPECPAAPEGYGEALDVILNAVDGDPLIVETWLRVCNAMTDERGGLLYYDTNDDGFEDVIVFPTIISDAGYGPGGAEGTVLIYHGTEDGGYLPAAEPEIYGQPLPLAIGDVNEDGRAELLWKLESCSTFCVTSAQVIAWTGESYESRIVPGAAIAEGTISLEPVAEGDPGQGQQLRLEGGVSGTPGGGLAVPHVEIWQSVAGGLYQRVRWTYDREAEGNQCLGLRLVEADMAMQASSVLGYEPAIRLYQAALGDPDLQACSLFGIAEDEELLLLRGLARFRLLQAQILNDSRPSSARGAQSAAAAILGELQAEQPDSGYTRAAQRWLDEMTASGEAAAACKAIQPIFEENDELWQITDHYGYDHPALAAEQICFVP